MRDAIKEAKELGLEIRVDATGHITFGDEEGNTTSVTKNRTDVSDHMRLFLQRRRAKLELKKLEAELAAPEVYGKTNGNGNGHADEVLAPLQAHVDRIAQLEHELAAERASQNGYIEEIARLEAELTETKAREASARDAGLRAQEEIDQLRAKLRIAEAECQRAFEAVNSLPPLCSREELPMLRQILKAVEKAQAALPIPHRTKAGRPPAAWRMGRDFVLHLSGTLARYHHEVEQALEVQP